MSNSNDPISKVSKMCADLMPIISHSQTEHEISQFVSTYMKKYQQQNQYDSLSEDKQVVQLKAGIVDCVKNMQLLLNEVNKKPAQIQQKTGKAAQSPGVKSDLNFTQIQSTMGQIIRIQAWWRKHFTLLKLQQDAQAIRSSQKAKGPSNNLMEPEELALKEYASQLKQRKITPEAFYRICDINGYQKVPIEDFKSQLSAFGLVLSKGQISRMAMIFDEELSGSITKGEYTDTLEAYNISAEKHNTIPGQVYIPFENRVMTKYLGELKSKNIDVHDVFNACDIHKQGSIDISELKTFVEGLNNNDFQQKEVHTIMQFLDMDKRGTIHRDQFLRQMNRAESLFKQTVTQQRVAATQQKSRQSNAPLSKTAGGGGRAKQNNLFEEEDMGDGDQGMNPGQDDMPPVYGKQNQNNQNSKSQGLARSAISQVSGNADDQRLRAIVQNMENTDANLDTFLRSLNTQAKNGIVQLGTFIKNLKQEFPKQQERDRTYLIQQCQEGANTINLQKLQAIINQHATSLSPSQNTVLQQIATILVSQSKGNKRPNDAISQYFASQNLNPNNDLSSQDFIDLFQKLSKVSSRDLNSTFQNLTAESDGFLTVQDLIVLLQQNYSGAGQAPAGGRSQVQISIPSTQGIEKLIPNYMSLSPRARQQEAIDMLIGELNKKSLKAINIFGMADQANSQKVSLQNLTQCFKKLLPQVQDCLINEALSVFQNTSGGITRDDFLSVLQPQQHNTPFSKSIGSFQHPDAVKNNQSLSPYKKAQNALHSAGEKVESEFKSIEGKAETTFKNVEGKVATTFKNVEGKTETALKNVEGKAKGFFSSIEGKVENLFHHNTSTPAAAGGNQEDPVFWIRKLDDAMLREGLSPTVAFSDADYNHNGVVSLDELGQAFKKFLPSDVIGVLELKKIMQYFDHSGNGYIEESEFINVFAQARNANVTVVQKSGSGQNQAQANNQNAAGVVDSQDLATLTQKLDQKLQIRMVLKEILINEHGEVSVASLSQLFKNAVTNSGKQALLPSDYLPILQLLDNKKSGIILAKNLVIYLSKYCQEGEPFDCEMLYIANQLEYFYKSKNTLQFFKDNTKINAQNRILQVELMSELRNVFTIGSRAGQSIFEFLEKKSAKTSTVMLKDVVDLIDMFRSKKVPQIQQTQQHVNENIDPQKVLLKIAAQYLTGKIKNLGLKSDGPIEFKDYYQCYCESAQLLTANECKSSFEFLKTQAKSQNTQIPYKVLLQTCEKQFVQCMTVSMNQIGKILKSLPTTIQVFNTQATLNDTGDLSVVQLQKFLTQIGFLAKQDQYALNVKNALGISFDLPTQMQMLKLLLKVLDGHEKGLIAIQDLNAFFLQTPVADICDELQYKSMAKKVDSSSKTQNIKLSDYFKNNAHRIDQIKSDVDLHPIFSTFFSFEEQHQPVTTSIFKKLGGKPFKLSDDKNPLTAKINQFRGPNTQQPTQQQQQHTSSPQKTAVPANNPVAVLVGDIEKTNTMVAFENLLEINSMPLDGVVPMKPLQTMIMKEYPKANQTNIADLCKLFDTKKNGKPAVLDIVDIMKTNIPAKYNHDIEVSMIVEQIKDPNIESFMNKNGFYPADSMSVTDFYDQLQPIANITRFASACIWLEFKLPNASEMNVKLFLEDLEKSKQGHPLARQQQQTVVAATAKNNQRAQPPKVGATAQSEAAKGSGKNKTQVTVAQKKIIKAFVDSYNKYTNQFVMGAFSKLQTFFRTFKNENDAENYFDPDETGIVKIDQFQTKLGQVKSPQFTDMEKVFLSMFAIDTEHLDEMKINQSELFKFIRRQTIDTNVAQDILHITKRLLGQAKNYLQLFGNNDNIDDSKDVFDMVKAKLQKLIGNQLANKNTMTKLCKMFSDNGDNLQFNDLFDFFATDLKCELEDLERQELIEYLEDENQDGLVSFQDFIKVFQSDEFKIPLAQIFQSQLNTAIKNTTAQNALENSKDGEKLSIEGQEYNLNPKRDFFRGCPTILNSEIAALVQTEKLYNALKNNQKYQDPDFGPKDDNDENGNKFSLFCTGVNPKGYTAPEDIIWSRPEEFCGNDRPEFIFQSLAPNDVRQGALGDCWFISALSVLSEQDEKVRGGLEDIKITEKFEIDEDTAEHLSSGVYPPIFHMYRRKSMYVIRFFIDFVWRYVIIDDRLPCNKMTGQPLYGRCSDIFEMWVPLIEKAYAKLNGCYETLISGFTDDGVSDMTGHVAEKIQLHDEKTGIFPHKSCKDKDTFWQYLLSKADEECMMGCSANGNVEREIQIDGQGTGILSGHAYAILDVIELHDPNRKKKSKSGRDTYRILCLRNPWGKTEWKQKWSDESDEMDQHKELIENYIQTLKPEDRFTLGDNDGIFFINYSSWRDVFNMLFVCIVFPEVWDGVRFSSAWSQDNSGGTPTTDEKRKIWGKNPQYYIKNTDKQNEMNVFLSLAQPNGRVKDPTNKTTPYSKYPYPDRVKKVGITIMKADKEQRMTQFDKTKLIDASIIKQHKEVSIRTVIPPGGAIIVVPATMNNGEYGNYFLSVYFDIQIDKVNIKELGKVNPYRRIQEEQEHHHASAWKIKLVQKRLKYMIFDEDNQIPASGNNSMNQSNMTPKLYGGPGGKGKQMTLASMTLKQKQGGGGDHDESNENVFASNQKPRGGGNAQIYE